MTNPIDFSAGHIIDLKSTDDETGEVRAVIGTMGVRDRVRDLVHPGALKGEHYAEISSWNHNSLTRGEMPVGSAMVYAQGKDVIADLKYDMDNPTAVTAYKQVKRRGARGLWSYHHNPIKKQFTSSGRDIYEYSIDEVSPVSAPASIGTRTVHVKSLDGQSGEFDMSASPQELISQLKAAGAPVDGMLTAWAATAQPESNQVDLLQQLKSSGAPIDDSLLAWAAGRMSQPTHSAEQLAMLQQMKQAGAPVDDALKWAMIQKVATPHPSPEQIQMMTALKMIGIPVDEGLHAVIKWSQDHQEALESVKADIADSELDGILTPDMIQNNNLLRGQAALAGVN